jgi:hypothetical protein
VEKTRLMFWYPSIIIVSQEAETRECWFEASLGKRAKCYQEKQAKSKKTGIMAQAVARS